MSVNLRRLCYLPPPKKEVVFSGESVCIHLFVCLCVCPLDYSKSSVWILMKFFGVVGRGPWTKCLDFYGCLGSFVEGLLR